MIFLLRVFISFVRIHFFNFFNFYLSVEFIFLNFLNRVLLWRRYVYCFLYKFKNQQVTWLCVLAFIELKFSPSKVSREHIYYMFFQQIGRMSVTTCEKIKVCIKVLKRYEYIIRHETFRVAVAQLFMMKSSDKYSAPCLIGCE
jgi:hypothetical protein